MMTAPFGEEVLQPAIALTGDAIQSMSPERLHEMAKALAVLLGVTATVGRMGDGPLTTFEETIYQADGDIPKFSLLIDPSKLVSDESDRLVSIVAKLHPNEPWSKPYAKRALTAVLQSQVPNRKISGVPTPFHFYFDPLSRRRIRPVRGVTISKPQTIFSDPEMVRNSTTDLGKMSVEALGGFVRALTTVWNKTDDHPFPFGPGGTD